jgi:hypothetical protein
VLSPKLIPLLLTNGERDALVSPVRQRPAPGPLALRARMVLPAWNTTALMKGSLLLAHLELPGTDCHHRKSRRSRRAIGPRSHAIGSHRTGKSKVSGTVFPPVSGARPGL